MVDFTALKNMRKNKSLDSIRDSISKQASGGSKEKYQKDERFWSVDRDESGNGSAVIRFLPKHESDELPWVRIFSHSFKSASGKWYIENSLTTLGKNDPVGDSNTLLWNSGTEANKDLARKQKRKLNYICNILVIKDPKNPENEGKVKLFKFGKKIFDMISDKIDPEFDDMEPVDVFDIDEGANFKFRIRQVEGYANYDKSEFAATSALCDGDDDEILKVLNAQHPLAEFIAADKFKSYEELKKRFDDVVNGNVQAKAEDVAVKEVAPVKQEPKAKIVEKVAPKVPSKAAVVEDDDDDMSYFKGIANDDDNPF